MVFTAVEQRRVQHSMLTANDAVVADLLINYFAALENLLQDVAGHQKRDRGGRHLSD